MAARLRVERGDAHQAVHPRLGLDEAVCVLAADLAPGTARFKLGGSSTHNGLRDITSAFGGQAAGGAAYWRLRIGIGHPRDFHQSGKPVVDYVLDRPSREHKRQIDESIERAIDAMPLVLKDDWPEAMKQLHTVASTD